MNRRAPASSGAAECRAATSEARSIRRAGEPGEARAMDAANTTAGDAESAFFFADFPPPFSVRCAPRARGFLGEPSLGTGDKAFAGRPFRADTRAALAICGGRLERSDVGARGMALQASLPFARDPDVVRPHSRNHRRRWKMLAKGGTR